jgi:hypothetical protein
MPTKTDPLTDRLSDAIKEAAELLPLLQRLLPESDGTGPSTGTIGRHAPESSEPWNAVVADAYWNLWHGPGTLVNYLRADRGMRRYAQPPWAMEALSEISGLAVAATDDALKYVTRKIERWCDLARRIPAIDESEPWIAVPAEPGARPPTCPYCSTFGLRVLVRRGEVRCFFPGCSDADGNPTRARMEPGRMTGEARLVFGDGMMLHFREAE